MMAYMGRLHPERCAPLSDFRYTKVWVGNSWVEARLCSSRACWPLAPITFALGATRKSSFFHTYHMLGTPDFTGSLTGSLQFSLEHSPGLKYMKG